MLEPRSPSLVEETQVGANEADDAQHGQARLAREDEARLAAPGDAAGDEAAPDDGSNTDCDKDVDGRRRRR